MSTRSTIYMFLGVVFLALLLTALLEGCTPAGRAAGRAAVVTTAEAVHAADVACAELVVAKGKEGGGIELGQRCSAEYQRARLHLILTANAVDSWDTLKSSASSVTCDVVHAMAFIDRLVAIIVEAGGKVPPIVYDARALVGALGACTEPAL